MQYALIDLGLTLIFTVTIFRVSTFIIKDFWLGENRCNCFKYAFVTIVSKDY